MATTNITLNAGIFTYEDASIKVNGSLNVNETTIQNISGQVTDNEDNIGSFDAWNNGEKLNFNVHFDDPSAAVTLLTAVQAAVEAVKAKLAGE